MEIKCMYGLGDNIFARPFIKSWAKRHDVYLTTCWPELFTDLNVKFLRPLPTSLRTQAKNIANVPGAFWSGRPAHPLPHIQLRYNDALLKQFGSITRTLERQLLLDGGDEYKLDLPHNLHSRVRMANAIIRPATVRTEWDNPARNPDPQYIYQIAERLMQTHNVILLADIDDKVEKLVGDLPPHHTKYIRGELSAVQALQMVGQANVVVGGVGWIVPAAIALGTKAFIILGGMGAHNAPQIVTDPRMDLSRIGFATPDNYCNCNQMRHACNKTISNLMEQWDTFSERASLRPVTFREN